MDMGGVTILRMYESGKAKAIGVSNYTVEHLEV